MRRVNVSVPLPEGVYGALRGLTRGMRRAEGGEDGISPAIGRSSGRGWPRGFRRAQAPPSTSVATRSLRLPRVSGSTGSAASRSGIPEPSRVLTIFTVRPLKSGG